ncbi:rhomboid family intramembrane serine protease [Candidatus Pacearchaeota archaeon]|nr:rhomboid family intramembrane serine protease [Candidatus Pacearchaeota archaeon]
MTINFEDKRGFFRNLSVTTQLIFANLIIFIILSISFPDQITEVNGNLTKTINPFIGNNVAITPNLILQGKSIWTIFTSMFMHANFLHIFANMFSLFFIGNFLERIIGKKRFFLIYLISGIVGGIFFVFSGMIFNSNIPGVGASGAIFGLIGILAVLVPHSRIYLIAGPLILLLLQFIASPFIPASFSAAFGIIINITIFVMIFAMLSFNPSMRKLAVPIQLPMWLLPIIAIVPLVIIGFFVDLPIGNSAHIGGLLVGLLYGIYLRKKFPNKTKMISRHFR